MLVDASAGVAPSDRLGSVNPIVAWSHVTCSGVNGMVIAYCLTKVCTHTKVQTEKNCEKTYPSCCAVFIQLAPMPRECLPLCACVGLGMYAHATCICLDHLHSGGSVGIARPGFLPLTTFNYIKLHMMHA